MGNARGASRKKAAERKALSLSADSTEQSKSDAGALDGNAKRHLRHDLLSKVLYGRLTPQQAEEAARAAGLSPFASEPAATEFDPMRESRWTLLQALAWIAWRDITLVMEQSAEYRQHCTQWTFREWHEPVDGGDRFEPRAGWSLENWHPPRALYLTMENARMRAEGQLPPSARHTPREAEAHLWRALQEGRLIAEGFNRGGQLVEIPVREWAHLKMFEEREEPVLKYEALGRQEFSRVLLLRDALLSIWPRSTSVDIDALELGDMNDLPLERVVSDESYLPLSLAICWVATQGGVRRVSLRNQEAWQEGVRKLLPRVSDGAVEVIGCGANQISEGIPRTAFALIDVCHPLYESLGQILAETSHIRSVFYLGEDEWKKDHNDQFVISGSLRPRWTHLQAHRASVLKIWPRPSAGSKSRIDCRAWLVDHMRASPSSRPKSKAEYKRAALQMFRRLTARQFAAVWDEAIQESGAISWSKAGRPTTKIKSSHRLKS
jgi:hypothetical protein